MFWVLYIAVFALMIVAMWMIFTKAGKPGWAAVIPFYNTYVLLKVAGKPGWWLILFFIPIVNIVFYVLACLALATVFGKGTGFAVGIIFLPIVFLPITAFDSSKYTAPGAPAAPAPPAAKPQ